MKRNRAILIFFAVFIVAFQGGCSWLDGVSGTFTGLVGLSDTATVIAKTAQVRTSCAVVAADMLEVKRGEKLDVLDKADCEKVLWYRVRARDQQETEAR